MSTAYPGKTQSRVRTFLEFVKIEHTLFALPFVLAGMLLGFAQEGMPLAPSVEAGRVLLLVLVAAVAARTLGMTLNRIVDRDIDAVNPRTAMRALPAGTMGLSTAWMLAAVSALLLFGACWFLNGTVLLLSPVLVLLFFSYPYAKRVTWACHLVLGLAFLCAPAGGFLAVTNGFAGWWPPFLLGLAALCWVAGFDVIYALLDVEFDRANDVQSIPARFGEQRARQVAAGLHALTVLFLALAARAARLDWPMYVAIILVAVVLAYEHAIVDHEDPEAINKAFFNVNAGVGWVVLAGLLAALLRA